MYVERLEKSSRYGRGERYDVFIKEDGKAEAEWYYIDFRYDIRLENGRIVRVNGKSVEIIDIVYPRNNYNEIKAWIEG